MSILKSTVKSFASIRGTRPLKLSAKGADRRSRRERNVMKAMLKKFLRDESGQSTTEYILILFVVVMVAMKFKGRFEKTMDNASNMLDGKLNEAFNGDGN